MIFKKISNLCVITVALVSTKVSCKLVTSEGDLIAWLGNSFGWEFCLTNLRLFLKWN